MPKLTPVDLWRLKSVHWLVWLSFLQGMTNTFLLIWLIAR